MSISSNQRALTIRQGSMSEVLSVQEEIPEFSHKGTEAGLRARLGGRPHLVLVAEDGGTLVGFKVGYELSPDTFYSWLGGVVPAGRRSGVAKALLAFQEEWVLESGYTLLRVKSMNRYPAMLRLLIGSGYAIVGTEASDDGLKIVFEKRLDTQ